MNSDLGKWTICNEYPKSILEYTPYGLRLVKVCNTAKEATRMVAERNNSGSAGGE